MRRTVTDYERFEESSIQNRRLLRQEGLILEVTETLAMMLAESALSQKELASRLGKTKGFVSQILAGGRNLTLRTIADFANALGYRLRVFTESLPQERRFERPPSIFVVQGATRGWEHLPEIEMPMARPDRAFEQTAAA